MERIAPQQETYGSPLDHHLTNGLYEQDSGSSKYYVPVTGYEDCFARDENPLDRMSAILDTTMLGFRQHNDTYHLMTELVEQLGQFYREYARDGYNLKELKRLVASHPLLDVLHEDPFTRHSFMKPRGYPGDAELLDFIYVHDAINGKLAAATGRGRNILAHNSDSPAPTAVRARRNVVAGHISEIAERRKSIRILSVACGHARELELLSEETIRSIKLFMAVDQDPLSLEVVRQYGNRVPSLVTRQASIVDWK